MSNIANEVLIISIQVSVAYEPEQAAGSND